MLAIVIFVAFWIVVAGGLFMLGRSGALKSRDSDKGRHRIANTVLVVTYVAFGLAIPAFILVSNANSSKANTNNSSITLTANEKTGRDLFAQHCAVCHTLAAANAVGKTGPNLDTLRPSEALILHTLAYGCLQQPLPNDQSQNCLGYGTMPADIVGGEQAIQVAQYVAKVAGQ